MAVDITQDINNPIAQDLGPIIRQARLLMKLEIQIGELQDQLAKKKEDLRKLATETIPDLMESNGVTGTISLGNGYTLTLDEIIRANLPANSTIEKANDEDRPQLFKRWKDGLNWLRKNKAGDLIKNTLRVDLGKGQDDAAKEFMELAKRLKVSMDRSETVHAGALSKFIKDSLQAGKNVPMETFAVYQGREAYITAPKKSKEKPNGKS